MRRQNNSKLTVIAGVICALLLSAGISAQDTQPEQGTGREEKNVVSADNFMVAAANPKAVEVGFEVLQAGGNAIDAAVAVQIMLNLVEPQSSGIGGGAFMLYWDAEARKLFSYDGRETAPAAAAPEYFFDDKGEPKGFWESVVGGRSVGVPGTLRLLEKAHREHGAKTWAELFRPSIELAEKGFPISARLAQSIAGAEKRNLAKFSKTRAYFFNQDGTPKAAGTVLQNPLFAQTLRTIAANGADSFYKGPIAEDIVAAVAATADNPGIMTLNDLAAYEVKMRPPVCVPYRTYQVCGMGPPTSGGLTVGQILGMLRHFDLPAMGMTAESIHLFAEAAKLAYADRGLYMADSDFVPMPTQGLIDPGYLESRARLIDKTKAMEKGQPGEPPMRIAADWAPDDSLDRPGTSHFVIRDAMGNAVSMTASIETGFGSRVMVRGFLLNNQLTDFSRKPEKDGKVIANRVEGGKRPRSSMSPTIVFRDDRPYLLLGSPGGSRIINYVAKTIIAVLDWGLTPQEAIDLGHFVNRNGATDLEQDTAAVSFQTALEALGHEIKVRDLNSGLHAILIKDGKLTGGADPRREGLVMGR